MRIINVFDKDELALEYHGEFAVLNEVQHG